MEGWATCVSLTVPTSRSRLTGHRPIQLIKDATTMMLKSGCDILVSVGGGSPIDSAKAIAHNVHKETGRWIPSIAVPTTLSVAETTQNAGFTTEEGHKIAVSDPEQVPKGRLPCSPLST